MRTIKLAGMYFHLFIATLLSPSESDPLGLWEDYVREKIRKFKEVKP